MPSEILTIKMVLEALVEQWKEYVFDKRHFTSRWLARAHIDIPFPVDQIALTVTFLFTLCVLMSDISAGLTNTLTFFILFLLTYIYPDEAPDESLLLLYWAVFNVMTLFDIMFDTILIGYYCLKLMALASLFLKPFEHGRILLARIEVWQKLIARSPDSEDS